MIKHYHLIGIGGIGMSGIAQLLLNKNCVVSGSDLKESRITQDLKSKGALIFIGHRKENIGQQAQAVIYSSAIKEDNPEMQEAFNRKLLVMKRAQALAELMLDKDAVTVSGSHGKTTTTSLVSYLFLEAGLSPTIAIGGIFKNIGNNASIGQGKFFVAEADESDGSFLYYQPKYSIITNLDYEHMDYYKNFDNAKKSFKEFMNRTSKNGCLFCCGDDLNLLELLKDYKGKYILFGLNENSHIYAKNIIFQGLSSEFDCYYNKGLVSRFSLSLAGIHNISNALSVIALGMELGIDLKIIKNILATYKGAGRRLEIKLQTPEYIIIDDYAHHPTEIKATLSALRNMNPKRLIAVFQPHRYSRTQLLLEEFGKCFEMADRVILTDIYPASESPIEGIDGKIVAQKIKNNFPGKETAFIAKDGIIGHLTAIIRNGDIVVMLGAGDITRLSDGLVEELKR